MAIETISATQHREWRTMIDSNAPGVTNEMRGKIEQFELLENPPERFVAYVKRVGAADGSERYAVGRYAITTWTGDVLGYGTRGSTWRVYSSYGSTMAQFYFRMAGREYTGRGFGSGMSIVLRETADSRRKRNAA